VNWFSRLFGKRSEPSPAPAPQSGQAQWRSNIISQSEIQIAGVTVTATIEGPGRGFVAVVGESHYQEALRAAKATQPLVDEPVVRASLVPEPTNPYDANAVAVHIEPFGTVGYLRRELAKTYSQALQQVGSAHCPAKLYGGTPDKPSIGVVLDATEIEGPALFTNDSLAAPNYERIEEYHRLRNANRETVDRTHALERRIPAPRPMRTWAHSMRCGRTNGWRPKNVFFPVSNRRVTSGFWSD
jgi:HIRAN domain